MTGALCQGQGVFLQVLEGERNDGADVQGHLVYLCRTGVVGLQALCDDPQEDAQHHVEYHPVAPREIARPLQHLQHALTQRQTLQN